MTCWPRNKNVKNPVLFIHIPKTAGTSVLYWMRSAYGKVSEDLHASVSQIENYKNCFSFTVIRNPYDRAVSFYKHRLRLNLDDKERESCRNGFEDWVVNYFDKPWLLPHLKRRMRNPRDTDSLIPLIPQIEWITFNNKILVDDILYYENLNEDFKRIQKFANFYKDLPFKNASKSFRSINYKEFYTPKAKEIIEFYYYKDIKEFNYSF